MQELLEMAWVTCHESEYADMSTEKLHRISDSEDLTSILNCILFPHLTTSRQYSARMRSFLSAFKGLDEQTIVSTLKNPEHAIGEAQEKVMVATSHHAKRGKGLRTVGMGLGAVAGGVLVGVTGVLAAPLVGAGVTTILRSLAVGGTAVGLLTSGLASSSVVCGALFRVYGARSTANIVERHTREIRDLALVPIRDNETLGVRLY